MRIWDISVPVSPTLPVWPGDPTVELERYMSLAADGANVTRLACSVHVGTHVDAPLHHIEGGTTVDRLALETLVGPALVVETAAAAVTAETLEELALPEGTVRLLLKTRNSELWASADRAFRRDYVALTPDAAEWVVQRGIRLLGVDYLSVQLFDDERPDTHRTLLGAGVILLEGADLSAVPPGDYLLACLPVKLEGADGAPARAVLIDGL